MADFKVEVVKIEEVTPIENADRIEAVRIGGYKSIVERGKYQPGDLAIYIPCSSLVPYSLQEAMGLTGKLSGAAKNRVKEIKLRGVLSEGLVLGRATLDSYLMRKLARETDDTNIMKPLFDGVPEFAEGADYAEALGIVKYEPAIPTQMQGRVKPYPFTMGYDIENIKKHSRVFEDGESVAISEKIHGTLIQVGLIHNDDGTTTKFVTSKGMGKAGLILDLEQEGNLYVDTARRFGLLDALDRLDEGEDIYIFGEVFGKQGQSRVQDLAYTDAIEDKAQFRAFDIYEGKKGRGSWLDVADFGLTCEAIGIPTVNYIWYGPYSQEIVENLTSGKETMSGKGLHIREGIVIRPMEEREERRLGRVILKSVSEAYLLRKGEVTEYA